MEMLIANYFIDDIVEYTPGSVDSSKLYLWVWHADKTPPHIGLSVDGNYFSLKANGKDEMHNVETIVQLMVKKNIVGLCFELTTGVQLPDLQNVFSEYSTTIPMKVTCLSPIKKVLEINNAHKLTDLLTSLYIHQEIIKVIGFNTGEDFSGIKNYSIRDIHKRLRKLAND